jgi:hypothetical protein
MVSLSWMGWSGVWSQLNGLATLWTHDESGKGPEDDFATAAPGLLRDRLREHFGFRQFRPV